jgi:type VI secretion system protein ImpM
MNSTSSGVLKLSDMVQGFFGKLPSLGDFVTRELPRDFLDAWDDWLQRSIAQSKSTLGDAWLPTYLHSPIWRFVLVPGVCGPKGWAGIMMPSVDKVGRYFPLTLASSLGERVQPFRVLMDATEWFVAAENLALNVLEEERVDADALASSVTALDNHFLDGGAMGNPSLKGAEWGLQLTGATTGDLPATVCHEMVSFQVGAYSVWWTPGSDDSAPMSLVAPNLPAPECFAYLLAGSWADAPSADTRAEPDAEAVAAGEPT